jgi:hypothetical protein
MTVCFSTRAPNADYLGFEASPEAFIAAAKKAVIGVDNMMWGSDEARRQSHRQSRLHPNRVRNGLPAGGRWIRTSGSARS